MKTKFLLLALLIVSASFSAAQDGARILAGVDGKCGLIDQKGNWIINPQFDEIGDLFWSEMVEVKSNGKWGYVNLSDKTIITPQYEEVKYFGDDGTAPVKMNGKWRFIDKTGKTVRETQIEELDFSTIYGPYKAKSNGKWGYIDTNYTFVIEPQYEDAGNFYNGLAYVKTNGKYGYIDTLGKIAIEPQFEEPGDFPYNWAAVKYNGKFGFINKEGKFIIEPKYEGIKGFLGKDSSAIIVKLNGKYGFIDKTGKTIVEPQYDEIDHFPYEGIAIVTQNGKYSVIDQTGKQLSEPSSFVPFMGIYLNKDIDLDKINKNTAAMYGLCAVRKKDKYGYIDSTGKFVIKPKFDYADDFYSDDYAKVIYKNELGWINKKNNTCFYDPNFEGVVISNNIICVKQGGKWGIVDETGKFTVEPKFNWVGDKILCSFF